MITFANNRLTKQETTLRRFHEKCLVFGICLAACAAAGNSCAQDTPGVSAGVFLENRTDSKVEGESLSFDYYGIRLKARTERIVEGFVDIGTQALDWKPLTADAAGCFGLGGTLWATRSEDGIFPADVGIYGSCHVANYTLTTDSGRNTDAKYLRYMIQGEVRAFEGGIVHPYLRAGIMNSKLEPNDESVITSSQVNATKPAINVGVELDVTERLVIGVEGNYSEAVGGAIRLDYWF